MRDVEILSIRHGRTPLNATGRFLGVTDSPLDAVGRTQAEALRTSLSDVSLARVASSPLARAWATAVMPGRPVTLVPGLREMHQGEFEGREVADVLASHPAFFAAWRRDPEAVVVPGGEGLGQVRDRGLAALLSLARAARPGQTVLAVSHQLVLASVAATLEGAPLREWTAFRSEHAGGWRLRFDGEQLRVVERIAPPTIPSPTS